MYPFSANSGVFCTYSRLEQKREKEVMEYHAADGSTKSERIARRTARRIARRTASSISRGWFAEGDLKRESDEDEETTIRGGGRRATVRPRHVESRVLKDVCKNT